MTSDDSAATEPTIIEIRQEQNETRRRILQAMSRLLEGTPRIAKPGRLSVAALAREAEVDRAKLTTGSARDLGERFARLAEIRSQPTTAKEVELSEQLSRCRASVEQLKDRHSRLRSDRDNWKALAEGLARALNLADRELEQAERKLERVTPDGPPNLRGL